ncbi:MAG: hypothetical protein AAB417_02070 [Patescibacteria group bacterium]
MRGQTLFEIIIALAIFSMIASILVSVSLGGFTALTQGGDQTKASGLAEEGMEALRSIRDGAWNEIRPAIGSQTAVVTGAISDVPKVPTGREWIFTAGAPAETLGKFTRTITLEAVCRDPQTRVISTCPIGAPDPHTERATVTVSWETRPGTPNTVARSSYLTGWDSRTWRQTDWSGGAGQTTWSDATRYNLDDGNIDNLSGELKLRQSSDVWIFDPSFSWASVVGGPVRVLNGIDTADGMNVWAVGGNGIILKYNGVSWSRILHNLGTQSINAVDVISPTDIWTAGNSGKIYHSTDGVNWIEDEDTGSHVWNSISMVSPTLGFAVGNSGWVARYNSGTWAVSKIVPGHSSNLHSVSMLSATAGWAVGASGKIFFWNGTTWAEDEDTGGQVWDDVFVFPGMSDGWVVGSSGNIYRWDGANWLSVAPGVSAALNASAFVSQTDGWALGNGGTTLRWNGAWNSITSPTSQNLNDIVLVGSAGWAVGNSGTILKLQTSSDYPLSGSLVSSAFPLVDNSPVESIEWLEQIPAGCGTCSVKFQIQTSADGTSWLPAEWMGPEGDDDNETDYFTLATGHLIPSIANGRQWVRYKAELTGDGANTPTLQEIRIQYK